LFFQKLLLKNKKKMQDFFKNNIRPNKILGQIFLNDREILKKIIDCAAIKKNELIVEVGPGTGFITKELAQRAKQVIAVEKDGAMIKILKKNLNEWHIKNVEVVEGDILIWEPKIKNYRIIANLPYYLSVHFLRKFLESENPPEEMMLMFQKEVGERICAEPPNASLLAMAVQFYAKANMLFSINKKSFFPVPKVDSAFVKIVRRTELPDVDKDLFFKILKAGFSHPRKQLLNNLSQGLKIPKQKIREWLIENNIDPRQRPENISFMIWIAMTKNLKLSNF